MKLVVIESPFAPPKHVTMASVRQQYIDRNQAYLRACALWALGQGWAPYASHKLLTQWLDDEVPEQRDLGIRAGLVWADAASLALVGVDYGISPGMDRAIKHHTEDGKEIEYIMLGSLWAPWSQQWPRAGLTMPVRRTIDRALAESWVQAA